MSTATAAPNASRVQAFDWLRGLAVLFMVQCHALDLLTPEATKLPLFNQLIRLDGLVAPAFTFAAGFSLALVQCRSALQAGRGARIRRSLRRIGEVLAIATLVNFVWFPLFREPKWLIRLDILHCVGLSLLVMLLPIALLAPRPKLLQGVMFVVAMGIFFVAPLTEKNLWPFDWLLNMTSGSTFPLMPWAGYVALGASTGAVCARGDFKGLLLWLGALILLGGAIWWASKPMEALYPPHAFWVTNPANCAQRWTKVLVILVGLLLVEKSRPAVAKTPPIRFLAVFGASSLAAYFFHEMLLFFPRFSFSKFWDDQASWPVYWLLLTLVLALTFGLVVVTDRLYKRYDAWLSGKKPAPTAGG